MTMTMRARRARVAGVLAAGVLAAGALLVPGLIAGCGRKPAGPAPVHLVFWQFWKPDLLEPAIHSFEAAHPGVKVDMETLTWQSGFEKILLGMASGHPPDLLELGSTWVPRFAAEGALRDVTADTDSLVPAYRLWEPVTWKGKRYGIPWFVGTRVLFVNRALFRRAGLDPDRPPATWAEFADAAHRVRALGGDIYGFGLNAGERYVFFKKFFPFAWSNGGAVLTPDGAHAALDSAPNLEALQFYLSLAPSSLIEKQEVIDRAFLEGRVGMMISGGWNLVNIPRDAPSLDFSCALMPRPAADRGEPVSFAGGEMLAVPAASAHGDLALLLAEHLARAENAAMVARSAKSILPAAKSADEDTTLAPDERSRAFVRQLAYAKAPPPEPRWNEMEEAMDGAFEEALYGRLSAKAALEKAQSAVEAVLASPVDDVAAPAAPGSGS